MVSSSVKVALCGVFFSESRTDPTPNRLVGFECVCEVCVCVHVWVRIVLVRCLVGLVSVFLCL